jgi:HNH endonuclease
MTITHPSQLSNHDLIEAMGHLARRERDATVALIVYLAEFDARRLYEGAGFPSTFQYCLEVLHLSEDAVFNRIEAARAARRWPAIVGMLTGGSLSVTTARLLARRLTAENHEELLEAAAGKGKRDVEEMLAQRFPQPDVTPSVRKVPMPLMAVAAGEAGPHATTAALDATASPASTPSQDTAAAPVVIASPRAVVRPLAPARYEIRFTATTSTRDKLREAQDLMAHAIPSGDIAQVFDRALTLLVADLRRKKFGETARPRRPSRPDADSDDIPAAVKRGVAARDGGRCRFVSAEGRRCGSRRLLEFHHVVPRSAGGPTTAENLELRCRAHNGYAVDRYFGPGKRRVRHAIARERHSPSRAPAPERRLVPGRVVAHPSPSPADEAPRNRR